MAVIDCIDEWCSCSRKKRQQATKMVLRGSTDCSQRDRHCKQVSTKECSSSRGANEEASTLHFSRGNGRGQHSSGGGCSQLLQQECRVENSHSKQCVSNRPSCISRERTASLPLSLLQSTPSVHAALQTSDGLLMCLLCSRRLTDDSAAAEQRC